MANVANTKHTDPASKDAISGGKKFPNSGTAPRGKGTPMDNTSSDAQRRIMSMRIQPGGLTSTK